MVDLFLNLTVIFELDSEVHRAKGWHVDLTIMGRENSFDPSSGEFFLVASVWFIKFNYFLHEVIFLRTLFFRLTTFKRTL